MTAMEGRGSVVSELEGVLLKNQDPFPYFMLMAFETSGLFRFALLLAVWPVVRLLELLGMGEIALRVMLFVAVAGVRESEMEAVARAVLPKFYMDDVDMAAWAVFSSYRRKVVVTKLYPRLMVEMFLREHMLADEVVGCELEVNRFGYASGFLKREKAPVSDQVQALFGDERPDVGLGRDASPVSPLSICKEQQYAPFVADRKRDNLVIRPVPVIFHDGRLVLRPTPLVSLFIILWIPIGILLAVARIALGVVLPMQLMQYTIGPLGGQIIVHGQPPPVPSGSRGGVLFVCSHRTLMDPVVLSTVLGRQVPAVTYSISRLTEMISPIPTVRLSRKRQVDADRIKNELAKGDLVVCPEGTTCREPFLLRFSALFAELTDSIVPVAMNYRVGLFHATTARGWKAMDPIFFMMNPRPAYEVTFLDQLPAEATCSAGRSPYDVANHVQRLLAQKLGFECTNFTRKDKYRVLAGNDGTVPSPKTSRRKTLVDRAYPVVAGLSAALGFNI